MNDQQVDNRNSPSYLSHYGMFRAPFMDTVEDDMYYAEPTRSQRLDILLHLAQYGNELLLVTGPEGSGKTTMLHQFMKKVGEDWKICQINAHNMLTEEQLLNRISRGFDLPEESGPIDNITTNLKRRLDAMLTTHHTVLVAVDNAHVLSTNVLNLLLEFASIRNMSKGIAVRILLFSEPQIKIQLASPELQSRQTLPIRKIDLPPFDEQQTSRLIRHRVTTAGLASKHVFSDAIISKIYKYSQGWPGLITEISHQVLFESTPLKRRDSNKTASNNGESTAGKRPLAIILALLVATGLAAVLLYQDQINALFNPGQAGHKTTQAVRPLTIPGQPTGNNAATSKKPGTSKSADNEEQEFPVIIKPDATLATSPEQAPTDKEPLAESTNEQSPANIKEAASLQSPGTSPAEPAPSSPTTVAQSAPPPPTATSKTTTRHDSIPLAHQEDWIMAQNPDAFTLQLVAGYEENTVLNFISAHKLPDADLAYYYSLNRGKAWHSLLFGSFLDRDQAKGAAREFSKHFKHLKPWIRSFKSVQGDILYAREQSQ